MNQKNQGSNKEGSQSKATTTNTTSEIKDLPLSDLRPSSLEKGGERRLDSVQFGESRENNESDNSDKD